MGSYTSLAVGVLLLFPGFFNECIVFLIYSMLRLQVCLWCHSSGVLYSLCVLLFCFFRVLLFMMIPLFATVKCWSFLDVFRYSSYWFAFLYFIGLSTWFRSCYVPVAATLLGCARFILFLFRSYISWGCPLFVLPCCYDCRLYITRLLHVAALPCYVVFCGHLMFLPSCVLLVAVAVCDVAVLWFWFGVDLGFSPWQVCLGCSSLFGPLLGGLQGGMAVFAPRSLECSGCWSVNFSVLFGIDGRC